MLSKLAAGEFDELAAVFAAAGFAVHQPAAGILQLISPSAVQRRVMLSVGIHGDETAPIEMLAELLAELAADPALLKVDLLIVAGNIAAIRAGKRYLDSDLNRLFNRQRVDAGGAEGPRADAIMDGHRRLFFER